jgi:hypothetical protein
MHLSPCLSSALVPETSRPGREQSPPGAALTRHRRPSGLQRSLRAGISRSFPASAGRGLR